MTLKDRLILSGILGLATVLRVVGLDAPLWYDEILTVVNSIRQPVFESILDYSSFNNHIFYTLQAKAIVALFGEHNWTVRLPALLFGVAGIAAVWWLARSVVGTLQAHVTAGLVAVSYHHVWFSQNARAYTELMFWWVISTAIFIEGIRRPSWKTWAIYAVVAGAAMYTHLTAGFSMAVHGSIYAFLLLGRWFGDAHMPKALKMGGSISDQFLPIIGFVLGGLFTIILYAPMLSSVVEQVLAVPSGSQVDVMKEYQNPMWTMLEVIRSLPGPSWATAFMMLAAIFFILLGGWGIGRSEPLVALSTLLFIPLTFILLMTASMRIWPRFFFADLGLIFLLLTHGVFLSCRYISQQLQKLTQQQVRESYLFAAAVFLMICFSAVLLSKNYRFPKQDMAGALQFIEAHQGKDDAVAAVGLARVPYIDYFEKSWQPVNTRHELVEMMDQSSDTWVVVIFPSRTERTCADLYDVVLAEFALAREFSGTLGDGNVLVYSTFAKRRGTSP